MSRFDCLIVVVDLDEVIINTIHNEENNCERVFIRPNVFFWLNYLKNKCELACLLVLWTRSNREYVAFLLNDLGNRFYLLFDMILTEKDCIQSMKHYGINKSLQYILKETEHGKNIELMYKSAFSVIIDDNAEENTNFEEYNVIYQIIPFNILNIYNVNRRKREILLKLHESEFKFIIIDLLNSLSL